MPIFSSRNMIFQIEDASGVYKLTLGPGPGDGNWPDIAEGGVDVAVIKDSGTFMGRIPTEDMEGEVTISLHHKISTNKASELFNAILHVNSWANATTCDPSGTVWTPSILILGDSGGEQFAIRWTSARIKVNGTRALAGNSLSLSLSVVGAPLYGDDAINWPT